MFVTCKECWSYIGNIVDVYIAGCGIVGVGTLSLKCGVVIADKVRIPLQEIRPLLWVAY